MKINEIIRKQQTRKPSSEGSDIGLIQYREDDEFNPELRDLCDSLVGLTSSTQARTILSIYFPELDWGGTEV